MDDWPPRPLRWPERPLTDGVVWLDRMSEVDVDDVVAAIDAEIQRWLPLPAPYGLDDAFAFLAWQEDMAERGATLTFALRGGPGGPLEGSIGLHFRSGPGVAEIGYWVAPAARGRGWAAAATRLLARHAFAAYRPRRIELLVQVANAASRRTAEHAGATYEGVHRAGIEIRGEPVDAAVYAFLPDDPAMTEVAGGATRPWRSSESGSR